jgi:hypothetical protein
MNFHDLTLSKRSALERRAFHFYRALARALSANFRPSASASVCIIGDKSSYKALKYHFETHSIRRNIQ